MAWLAQQGIRAQVHQALRPSDEAVIDFLRKEPTAAILINRDSACVDASQIRRVVNELDCPLILC